MNIKQIAKKAGVSVATVSRVLNHPENVAPATRERIQAIIEEEEYTPNWLAQGLNFNRTKTVGLVIPHTISTSYMEIANGVEEVARQKGYITFMCNVEKDIQMEKEYIRQLITRKVDGIILTFSALDGDYMEWIDGEGIPAVLIGENESKPEWSSVTTDCRAGAAQMASHLLECGHKSIGMLYGRDPEQESREILRGCGDLLRARGRRLDRRFIICVDNNIEGGYIGARKMILEASRPGSGKTGQEIDAIFATSDEIAYGAMDAIKDSGLAIPGDIAVAGFGNNRMSNLMEPKLTTVEQPFRKMGIYGARILFDLIDEQRSGKAEAGGPPLKPRHIILQTKMRIRKSCGHKERIGEMF